MRRWLPLLLFLSSPASAGLFGADAPARIPIPARVFRVEVEDIGGVVLVVDRATFDGEVFVYGTIGRAQVTVPFDAFTSLEVRPGPDEDHRTVVISGAREPVEVVVEADRPFYGRTGFGNYKIEIGVVRRLTILGETPRE